MLCSFVKLKLKEVLKCLDKKISLHRSYPTDVPDRMLANHHRCDGHVKNRWRRGVTDVIATKHHICYGSPTCQTDNNDI